MKITDDTVIDIYNECVTDYFNGGAKKGIEHFAYILKENGVKINEDGYAEYKGDDE
ncbi:hypothetical protein [Halocella sp. SP3-1]|uniref:hypothetical protein n=1 Tax=Halocella sp. SP3-1 TaxID=2382161 RepID=UPI0013DF7ECF|nr:hypothetical protein [Halocella sp. SP3-1]